MEYFDRQIGLEELRFANKFIKDIQDKNDETPDDPEEGEATAQDDTKQSQLAAIKSGIEGRIARSRNETLVNAQKILKSLLADYEDNKVELDYSHTDSENLAAEGQSANDDANNKLFNGKLRVKDSNMQLNPREYFNNFRFKLYLISIRIAVAFHIMKQRKISFPLLFDDVFDSSDFNNRLQTEKFFRKIREIYKDLKIGDSPLQLMFFTQDEVIAESIFEGLAFDEHDIPAGNSPTILGRLFSVYPESELSPNEKYVEIGEGIRFYNLYDTIRTSI